MRDLIGITLDVSLAVHALLGCCAHHAHAGHDEMATHEHADHGDEGEGDKACEESECVFAGGTSRIVIDSPLSAPDFAAGGPIPANASSDVHNAVIDRFAWPGLCILHQRLLI